jgi:biotin carboxyl carrier protein
MTFNVTINETDYRLDLEQIAGEWRCRLDGSEVHMDAVQAQPDVLSLLIDGKAYEIRRERTGNGCRLWVGDRLHSPEVRDPRSLRGRRTPTHAAGGTTQLVAPMPGKVIRFLLAQNAPVEAGQGVVVVEAMKMQNEIKSPKKGTVLRLAVAEGAAVNAGDVLAVVE